MDWRNPKFKSVELAAADLGVPFAWLRREAKAGHVPCVLVGKRLLMDPGEVAEALVARGGPEQNSHLIAAAPELLEALEDVTDRLENVMAEMDYNENEQRDMIAIQSAREVIAKAKGQTSKK